MTYTEHSTAIAKKKKSALWKELEGSFGSICLVKEFILEQNKNT